MDCNRRTNPELLKNTTDEDIINMDNEEANSIEIFVPTTSDMQNKEPQSIEKGTGVPEIVVTASSDETTEGESLTGSLKGITKKTEQEMYDLYNAHAQLVGFSVRRHVVRYKYLNDGSRILVYREYVCSCEGRKRSTKEWINVDGSKRKKSTITRTGCKAIMKVKLTEDDVFEVVEHNLVHNHNLTRPELSYMHRSSRQINEVMETAIEKMDSSGIKPTQAYRYLVEEAGGSENVGHTLKDHLNLVSRWKAMAIEGGDAETIFDMLQKKDKEESDFFYKIKMDQDGRLSHIFWRDSMMKDDYDIFGDIVVFDTTYRTNRYDLICAPFVGINNHRRNVMYGCAFLSDEKIESFEWLFSTFKKSMAGKSPITIFTDQDHAISSALEKVFPETRHRLCIWHLYQNAVSRLGKLKSNRMFKDTFDKCLTGCVNADEFEACWNEMVTKYELKENSWFIGLYGLKNKWCTALSKDCFSAGILSSQRSESANSTITFKTKKTTSLTEFFETFEATVRTWRENELKDEFQSTRITPDSSLPMTGMLNHASMVYTLSNFRLFEKEFMEAISHRTQPINSKDGVMLCEVRPHDRDYARRVIFDNETNLVACECKKFEECGILCSHCLQILLINSVDKIPDIYIAKRWTKEAKMELWNRYLSGFDRTKKLNDCPQWRVQIFRTLQNTVMMSQEIPEARKIIEEATMKMALDVTAIINSLKTDQQPESSENSILDPARVTTKGRRKRMRGKLRAKNHQVQVCLEK